MKPLEQHGTALVLAIPWDLMIAGNLSDLVTLF